MRRHLKSTLGFAAMLVVCAATRVPASLIVESWGLETGIIAPNDQVFDVSYEVQNPLILDQRAAIGASTADTSLHFAWSDSGADFLIQGSQRAHDASPPLLRSISTGRIDLISSVDLLFTAEGSYTYDLPGSAMAMSYGLSLVDDQDPQAYFTQGLNDDSFLNGSAGGTFVIDGQAILPAGRPAHIRYTMTLDVFDSSGLFATGSGYFHFTFQEVPEPSTAALLFVIGLLLRPRHRRLLRRCNS